MRLSKFTRVFLNETPIHSIHCCPVSTCVITKDQRVFGCGFNGGRTSEERLLCDKPDDFIEDFIEITPEGCKVTNLWGEGNLIALQISK
jgi:hypothetical protein